MNKEHYYGIETQGVEISKEDYDRLIQNKLPAIYINNKKINVQIPITQNITAYYGVVCEIKQEYFDKISNGEITSHKQYINNYFVNKLDKNNSYCLMPYIDGFVGKLEVNGNPKTLNESYEFVKSLSGFNIELPDEYCPYKIDNEIPSNKAMLGIIGVLLMACSCISGIEETDEVLIKIKDVLSGINIDNCEASFKYPNVDYYTVTFNMKNSK